MEKIVCKGGTQRSRWAVSLCFASATLSSLEALHPSDCVWMNMDANQLFALSAGIATLSMFMATFILTQIICGHSSDKS